ncbi:MAG: hypothetical protein D6714_19550 [Bacteroidetes bacterium]|nr:MAG: hypothetical protein D6714_19550 [Bacteroidota bacterium]
MKWAIPYLTVLIAGTFACSKPPQTTTPAFYYWKSRFELSEYERNYLTRLPAQKLYIRFFDVDWDFDQKRPVPKGMVTFADTLPPGLECIPVVFITNRTLTQIGGEQLPDLAQKISRKLRDLAPPGFRFREIQLDCDWSQSTQTVYFDLIQLIRSNFAPENPILTATIRLHQVKYFEKTGVPPVQRGMLMYYNMSDIQDPAVENSILDNKVGQTYLFNFDRYPLPLDLALPVFHWGVLFRDGHMIRILNNLTAAELADTSRFQKTGDHRFEVQKSTYLNGHYLYRGDELRLEAATPEQVIQSARLVRPLLHSPQITLALYHLDSLNISNFPVEKTRAVFEKLF